MLLITLLALQPVVSYADTHLLNQTSGEHTEATHEHNSAVGQTDTTHDANQMDCQHCCHCHGVVHFFDITTPSHVITYLPSSTTDDLTVQLFSYLASPDNPPPIG